MSDQPRISIVIETLNYERGNEHLLVRVLEALQRQTVPARDIELILVVDPADHPELEDRLREVAPQLRVIEAPGAHYYGQKNRGAEAARAPVVGFIDSDCTPLASWAESVLARLETGERAPAAVQGTVVTDGSIQGQAFAITSFGQVQARAAQATRMLTGNNCAFRREQFLAAPFEEAPWFHGPEVKKIADIYAAGGEVILDPGAQVQHAFYPGLANFLAFSAYWGWCFLHLRRGAPRSVAHARLFDGLGWLAPLALVPAKICIDTLRAAQARRSMGISRLRLLRCCLFLYLMAPAVGYGALLERLGRKPITPLY